MKHREAIRMRILKRDYDVAVGQIKGVEKLDLEQLKEIDKCKLSREIVVLDETRYSINADGEPEMTRDAQIEYDEFVSQIRQGLSRDDTRILDEGYGEGDNELEWHITVCVVDKANTGIVGVLEVDTCVRTEEGE